MRETLQNLLAEPKALNPPPRGRLDFALAGVLGALSVAEGMIVDDIAWPGVAILLALGLSVLVLWGRSHALLTVAIAFGLQAVVDTVAIAATGMSTLVVSTVVVGLILTYALCRWASGRAAAAGLALIVITHLWTELINPSVPVGDAIIGLTAWLFPAALALAMRYRVRARERTVFDARMLERDQLARELHDTVSHHVTAITIQAQAARLVLQTDLDRAALILATIERESSRAVDEMQQIVQVLRHPSSEATTEPQPGLRDIAALGEVPGSVPLEVSLEGELDELGPTLQTSLFRVAQEAITNSRRHARDATKVLIQVTGTEQEVMLCVRDDGEGAASRAGAIGYGLVGMSERIALLGGTFDAAPGAEGGWSVTAVLPRRGGR